MQDFDINEHINKNITPTAFEDKDMILTDKSIQCDVGFVKLPSGNYLVSMVCPMPGITKEMIDWWFWWHPQKGERYRKWYPGEHFTVFYSPKDTQYFKKTFFDSFSENTQYPVEKIGSLPMPLSIDFKKPVNFGFSMDKMKEAGTATIVCGTVGAFFGAIKHTQMAHIFFKKDEGLFLVSRFWIGQELKNPLLRKIFLKEKTAKDMAVHCYYEYRKLASLLPGLIKEKDKTTNGDEK